MVLGLRSHVRCGGSARGRSSCRPARALSPSSLPLPATELCATRLGTARGRSSVRHRLPSRRPWALGRCSGPLQPPLTPPARTGYAAACRPPRKRPRMTLRKSECTRRPYSWYEQLGCRRRRRGTTRRRRGSRRGRSQPSHLRPVPRLQGDQSPTAAISLSFFSFFFFLLPLSLSPLPSSPLFLLFFFSPSFCSSFSSLSHSEDSLCATTVTLGCSLLASPSLPLALPLPSSSLSSSPLFFSPLFFSSLRSGSAVTSPVPSSRELRNCP